jgi:hypothetical protein
MTLVIVLLNDDSHFKSRAALTVGQRWLRQVSAGHWSELDLLNNNLVTSCASSDIIWDKTTADDVCDLKGWLIWGDSCKQVVRAVVAVSATCSRSHGNREFGSRFPVFMKPRKPMVSKMMMVQPWLRQPTHSNHDPPDLDKAMQSKPSSPSELESDER